MKVYELKRQQKIALPLEQVFSFFERPENLAKLTPPSLGFQILTPSPIEMKSGCLIDYIVRIMGLPVRWTTLITDYDPPHRFADVQLKGPYSYWHHTHLFEAVEGGTVMTDTVRYALPFGWLGRIAQALAVKGQLRRIFHYRSEVLLEHLGPAAEDHPGGSKS
jgi:ligand-binding SRPBCC domain-containing protein